MANHASDDYRWGPRDPDDDLAAHPLFGGNSNHAGPLFMDVTHTAQSYFNTMANLDDPHRRACALVDEDDDGDEVTVAKYDDLSVIAGPPSQPYTEAASSQSTLNPPSNESLEGFSSAKVRTDDVLGFWAHHVTRTTINTPQLQRTFAMPGESPATLVDNVVRAGLETPSRNVDGTPNHFGTQRPQANFPLNDGASSASEHSARSSGAAFPPSSNSSSVASHQSIKYRTVQQYYIEQQGKGPEAPPAGAAGLAAATNRNVSTRPTVPGRMPFESCPIVILEFKMERRRRFRCSTEIAATVVPDQWIVVQLDNGGVDMGCCVEVFQAHDRLSIPKHYGHGEAGVVLRLADDEDCKVLNEVIPAKEELALSKAHQLVHFLHMPFTCIDAEFQFDLKAVNLYYELTPQAFTSIIPNVSRLSRELGFMLKAKVHLEQLVPVTE